MLSRLSQLNRTLLCFHICGISLPGLRRAFVSLCSDVHLGNYHLLAFPVSSTLIASCISSPNRPNTSLRDRQHRPAAGSASACLVHRLASAGGHVCSHSPSRSGLPHLDKQSGPAHAPPWRMQRADGGWWRQVGGSVSAKPIVMRAEYAYCPNLTIIDTPGFILKVGPLPLRQPTLQDVGVPCAPDSVVSSLHQTVT